MDCQSSCGKKSFHATYYLYNINPRSSPTHEPTIPGAHSPLPTHHLVSSTDGPTISGAHSPIQPPTHRAAVWASGLRRLASTPLAGRSWVRTPVHPTLFSV